MKLGGGLSSDGSRGGVRGGTSAASTAVSTGNPLTDLKLAQINETKDVAQEAKTPQVQRDIAAFTAGLAKAKDIKTALGPANPNVMKVLLTASNLSPLHPVSLRWRRRRCCRTPARAICW